MLEISDVSDLFWWVFKLVRIAPEIPWKCWKWFHEKFVEIWNIIKIGKNGTFLDSKLPTVYCAHPIQMEELYIKKSLLYLIKT